MTDAPHPDAQAATVHVREGTHADLDAVVRLLADDALGATREKVETPVAREYVEAFDAMLAQRGNSLLIASIDGEVVGCLQLTIIPGLSRLGAQRAQIEGVRVASGRRGGRIGEAMMQVALERARSAGCTLVQLTTDATRRDAHRFYERLGFEASHVGFKLRL